MSTPCTKTLRLLAVAADLRAAGASWEAVATRIGRRARECRFWPRRYPDPWAAMCRVAQRRRTVQARAEAVSTLRDLLRSVDEKTKRDSARSLLTLTRRDGDETGPVETDPYTQFFEDVRHGEHSDILAATETAADAGGGA